MREIGLNCRKFYAFQFSWLSQNNSAIDEKLAQPYFEGGSLNSLGKLQNFLPREHPT